MSYEDPDSFMFEFDKRIIGKSYLIYDFEIIAYLYHIDQIFVHLKL
jgi:hypothetical protein